MQKQGFIPFRPRIVLLGIAIAACSVFISILIIGTTLVRVPAPHTGGSPPAAAAGSVSHPQLVEAYGKLPLSFEINRGQTDPQVKFLSRGSGYSLFLTGNEAVLALKKPGARSQKSVAPPFGAARQGGADLGFRSAAFPGLLRSPGTDSETNSRTADPKPGSALQEPVPNLESRTAAMLRMKLVGANPQAKVSGLDELPGKSNYFIGNDPKKWRTNVANYAKVKYKDVYPGVDLVYYGNQGQLEYDFVVKAGADPQQIVLDIGAGLARPKSGARGSADLGLKSASFSGFTESQAAELQTNSALHVDANGDLVVATDGGEVVFHKPAVYQPAVAPVYDRRGKIGGDTPPLQRQWLNGSYVLAADNRVTFEIPAYDQTRPLVIDPVLAYSTYLGGSDPDGGSAIAVDAAGNAYVTGYAYSLNFPTTPGAVQTTLGGGPNSCADAFVGKLNATGSALLYSTYMGGSNCEDIGYLGLFGAVAVDALGNAYVTGYTNSTDFPTTVGAFKTSYDGTYSIAFVSKLNATGSALLYSTYLGGGVGDDYARGIAVDASGSAYVVGSAGSGFPTTPGAFQITYGGGSDAFVSKLNAAGSALVYSTYLGGNDYDDGYGIAVDASSNAYVTGSTRSSSFPTTSGALQTIHGGVWGAFVSKLNAAGSTLLYSTYLGGSVSDGGTGIAVDAPGNAYVIGFTDSSDFPTTPGAFQTTHGGQTDAFVGKLNSTGSALLYSTYVGGSSTDEGHGIAVDASGNAYVAGLTYSSNFPTTSGAFQTTSGGNVDVFVAKLNTTFPFLVLTPSSLTFTPQPLGITSAGQKARLSNAGSKALTIISIVAGGEFSQTNDCPGTVAPGGFCTLSVTFAPTVSGTRTGAVTITDNAAGSSHKLPLTGIGGVPAISLGPASLIFASQAVGTTSPAQPAMLKNTGTGPLSITSIAAAGDFAQTNNCGSTVNPGASCTLNVTFRPTATGTRAGTISITDDAQASPHQVSLTGTAFTASGPIVSLTPASLTFAAQAVGTFSPARLATLKNTGAGTLKIISIGPSGDFYEGNNCPTTLAPNASCTLRVTFSPTSGGSKSGAVTIWDNAPGSPHKLPLSGTGSGTGSIILKLSPASISFGSVTVGATSSTQTVTLTNIGTAAASFLEPFGFATQGTNWSDFHKQSYCGTSLAPKASCKVGVFFKPLATGTRTGYFAVRQGAASVRIPLSGTGTP